MDKLLLCPGQSYSITLNDCRSRRSWHRACSKCKFKKELIRIKAIAEGLSK